MGNEDGNAVSDSHGERDPLLGRDVSIGLPAAEPPLPATGVYEHARAVNLPNRSESPGRVSEIVLYGGPPGHDLVDRLLAREAEGAGVPGSSERANPPTLEVGDYFPGYFTHAY